MSGKKANPVLAVQHGVGVEIALNATGGAADWIMVMPAGNSGVLLTVDGRGPYRVSDPDRIATEALQSRGRLPIDENHATDLAAPSGGPSPARGWIVELQARADGIFGRVEWSAAGAALMAEKAYRYLSPVFTADAAGNVLGLLRASLTNTPNLRGMPALNAQETSMDMLAQLRKLLGLADDADEAAVIAKITAMNKDAGATDVALQSALAPIAKIVGLKDDAGAVAVLASVTALAAAKPVESAVVTALQSELATMATRLNDLTSSGAKDKSTAYVDGEIAKGRVGMKPMRDHYITMHSASAEGAANVEKIIGALPMLGPSGALQVPPDNKDGKISLNAEQKNVARLLGITEADFIKTLASEAA